MSILSGKVSIKEKERGQYLILSIPSLGKDTTPGGNQGNMLGRLLRNKD
jgi:hypothetical protein